MRDPKTAGVTSIKQMFEQYIITVFGIIARLFKYIILNNV